VTAHVELTLMNDTLQVIMKMIFAANLLMAKPPSLLHQSLDW